MAETQPTEATLEMARQVWRNCCELGLGDSEIAEQIAVALAEREQAETEGCIKAVCGACSRGEAPFLGVLGTWLHIDEMDGSRYRCNANALHHRLHARQQPVPVEVTP